MRKGFTLIELLIVVAIIAILAAIAVPNFLEAQTRSKISRTMADMRSIATALESYAVDYGKYPLGQRAWSRTAWNGGPAVNLLVGLSKLTTPVAYMSSMPKDPFVDKSGDEVGRRPGYPPVYETLGENQWGMDVVDYGDDLGARSEYGYRWVLYSKGPARTYNPRIDRVLAALYGAYASEGLWVYDSTNGTKSIGYIIHTNKGHFPD